MYLSLRKVVIAMSKQSLFDYNLPNGQTFKTNYKHDGIYVGITKGRALTYACLNRYGSEILEHCILLYQMLTSVDESFKLPDELNLFHIEKYIGMEQKPILIEIINVNDNDL